MNGKQDSTRWKRQELCQEVEASDATRQPCGENASRFNQLPRDILAEVFVQCLPEVQLWPIICGSSTKDVRVAPLLICNVCSTWRAVALATPRLWQTLFLGFEHVMPKSKVEEAVAMTHIWIKRSGALPLTLTLYVARHTGQNKALAKALVNAFFDYTSRWEHVGFYYLCIPLSQHEHMPCLRTLSICAYERSNQFPFTSCPKLARIRWHLNSAVSSAPLPWHQLTHIYLHHTPSTRDIIFVIRSCPKLTVFESTLKDEVQESLPREIVVNKSLRKLEIFVSQTCNSLLKRLALPALTDIFIELLDEFAVTHGFQKELLGLFSRSKCKLNRMGLVNGGFDDEGLLECLKHDSCTALTDLRISEIAHDLPIFTDPVLLALTDMRPVENNLLLPKLACLSLESCLAGSPSRLGTMILSRCISRDKAVQLHRLKIFCLHLDERDIALIQLAQIQGLEFSLNGDDEDEDEW